jgi:Secretion system C-terminal sorting domain
MFNQIYAHRKILWGLILFSMFQMNNIYGQRWLTCADPAPWGNVYGQISCHYSGTDLNPPLLCKYDDAGNRIYVDYGPIIVELVENEQSEKQSDKIRDADKSETLISGDVNVFPNPTSETLFIETQKHIQDGSYQLYDLNGRLISEQQAGLKNSFDVSALPSGVYVLKLKSSDSPKFQWKIFKK